MLIVKPEEDKLDGDKSISECSLDCVVGGVVLVTWGISSFMTTMGKMKLGNGNWIFLIFIGVEWSISSLPIIIYC